MTRIYDAHAHLGSEAERRVRREQDIVTMVCAGTLAQAERLSEEAARNANILPAAGLHPWHCDKCSVGEMRPFLERVPVIGEIGLDSVWCQVPMEIQRRAFEAQLDLAAQMGKPVVLHTKGMEAEIARTIKNTRTPTWFTGTRPWNIWRITLRWTATSPWDRIWPAIRRSGRWRSGRARTG